MNTVQKEHIFASKSIGPRAGVIYSWLYIQQHTAGFSIGSRTSYGRSWLLSLFSSWKCMNYVFAAGLIFNIILLQIKPQWDRTKSYHNLWAVISLQIIYIHDNVNKSSTYTNICLFVYGVYRHFQQHFSYIEAVSYTGGGNRRTQKTTDLSQI